MAQENLEEYKETLAKQGFETFTVANVRLALSVGQEIKKLLTFRTAEPVPFAVAIKQNTMYLINVKVKGIFKANILFGRRALIQQL